jgi:hypothetical protein
MHVYSLRYLITFFFKRFRHFSAANASKKFLTLKWYLSTSAFMDLHHAIFLKGNFQWIDARNKKNYF